MGHTGLMRRSLTGLALPLIALLALHPTPGAAQSLELALGTAPRPGSAPRFEVTLRETPGAGQSVRVAVGDGLELGARLRRAGSLGPLGNLIGTAGVDVRSGGGYRLAVAGRGVVGPVALRVRASAFDTDPAALPDALDGPFPVPPPPPEGVTSLGLEVGVDYRLARSVILSADPGVFLTDGALATRFTGALRFAGAYGPNDLSLLLDALAAPGDSHAAFGVGVQLNRRRAPSWSGSVWLGAGAAGASPGVRISGAEQFGATRLAVTLAAEPYRADRPYRLAASAERPFESGTLSLAARAAFGPRTGWVAGGRVGWVLPVARRP